MHSVNFQGRFDQLDIEDAIPQSLLEFVSMIESQQENGVFTMSDQAMAQLLQLQCLPASQVKIAMKRSRNRKRSYPS